MRREVARVAVTAAWIALAVLAGPLAVSVHLLVAADERGQLERAALRAAVRVDPRFAVGDPAELPAPEPGGRLGLYDPAGRLRAGNGPARADSVTEQALTGRPTQGQRAGQLVVAVPVSGGERVTGVVRAASPAARVWWRTAAAWGILAALMALALLAALGVARRRARRLAAPLETLAAASRAVGDGDFTARVPACGVAEIDNVAATQNATAGRLGELLERQRQFTANASHQLRTPLAGLQLGLEAALADARADPRAALDEALATTRRLQATVEDVLALHQGGGVPNHDPAPAGGNTRLEGLLEDVADRWRGQFATAGRRLSQTCDPGVADRSLPAVRVGQILDVLLDNALRHGAGQVRLTARPAGADTDALAVSVADEGPGIREDLGDVFRRGSGSSHGIGLGLARDFAASLGGRLVLSCRTPPMFTLLLPAPVPAPDPDPDLWRV
jgi:signal transduction histidine kinase